MEIKYLWPLPNLSRVGFELDERFVVRTYKWPDSTCVIYIFCLPKLITGFQVLDWSLLDVKFFIDHMTYDNNKCLCIYGTTYFPKASLKRTICHPNCSGLSQLNGVFEKIRVKYKPWKHVTCLLIGERKWFLIDVAIK